VSAADPGDSRADDQADNAERSDHVALIPARGRSIGVR
jgi:hypothetical protein